MENSTKVCTKCGVAKSESEFYWDSRGRYFAECKACSAVRSKTAYRARYKPRQGASNEPRPCAQCGQVYRPRTRTVGLYCSPKCKDRARPRVVVPVGRKCPHCGDPLASTKPPTAIFCSKPCRDSAHRLQSKLRTRTGEPAKAGYLRAYIGKRDGHKCGICGRKVDMGLKYPSPDYGTLDHIVPVSQGGTSDTANLRLAHDLYNRSRGNRGGGEQLALVG